MANAARAQPKVVIIGAGIVGCAVADELAARGVADITLIERGAWPRPGGSTSHAPGLVFQTNSSETMTRFAGATLAGLDGLSFDGEPCSLRIGSMEVATNPERLAELYRRAGWARGRGLDGHLLDPAEAANRHSLVDPARILGALYVPGDAWVRPYFAAAALAERSGARIVAETSVTAVRTGGGAVRGVETDRGYFDADVVVCCAGIWGPLIGRLAGVRIPLQPMAHQYAISGPVPALANGPSAYRPGGSEVRQPILRHQGAGLYFREHGDRFGVGSYSHRPLPIEPETIGGSRNGGRNDSRSGSDADDRAAAMPSVRAFTPEDFADSWAAAVDLLPALDDTEPAEGINGIFSFTADGAPLLGQTKELDGFWVAEAVWISHSVGAARAVAEGICDEAPTLDLHECDLERFEPEMKTPASFRPQAVARFVEVYDIIHPLQPPDEPRPLRTSPFYMRQIELGAQMLVGNGWERPQWYDANAGLVSNAGLGTSAGPLAGAGAGPTSTRARPVWQKRDPWSSRYWSPTVGAEHLAVRDGVGLFDMTSLRRLELSGPGALALIDRLTTTKMDKRVGSVSYTLMLDAHGGIRSDITVARLDEQRFWIGTNGPSDEAWITGHSHGNGQAAVDVRDITGSICCLGLWGPKAGAVIEPLVDTDLDIPYFSFRRVHVGEVPVTALRVSYVGEYGWELYTTADYGQRLWDLLQRHGAEHGLIAAGRGALDSMRIEKGYRAWGRDMTAVDSPEDAGLDWAVNRKLDFIGRGALDWRPSLRRLRTVTLNDPTRVILGGETVYLAGRAAGCITSAGYGYSIGRTVAYAWLPADCSIGIEVEIDWFAERLAGRVVEDTLWDPLGHRVRNRPATAASATQAR